MHAISKNVAACLPFCVAVLLMLGGCTGFDLLNATTPSSSAKRTLDVSYGGDPRQRLDVYQPSGLTRPAPVVLFFYGGYWRNGHKWDYRFVGKSLAARGFVAVVLDYRVFPNVRFPAFVEDGAAAVRWAHDHISEHGGDPNRIFLLGHSAGAHIAALVAFDARYVEKEGLPHDVIKGLAGLSGAYDFVPSPENRPVFNLGAGDPERPRDIEPIEFARADAPPTLLIHGAKDRTADPQNSANLADRLRRVGANVRYLVYPKGGHADLAVSLALPWQWVEPTLDDVTTFVHDVSRRQGRE